MEVAPSAMNKKGIATANCGSWPGNTGENHLKSSAKFFDLRKQENSAKARKGWAKETCHRWHPYFLLQTHSASKTAGLQVIWRIVQIIYTQKSSVTLVSRECVIYEGNFREEMRTLSFSVLGILGIPYMWLKKLTNFCTAPIQRQRCNRPRDSSHWRQWCYQDSNWWHPIRKICLLRMMCMLTIEAVCASRKDGNN